MILILKEYTGDEYEIENIVGVLDINTSKSSIELKQEHNKFLIDLLRDNGIPTYDNYPSIMGRVPGSLKRLHKTLSSQNNMMNWLKANYECKELVFSEIDC